MKTRTLSSNFFKKGNIKQYKIKQYYAKLFTIVDSLVVVTQRCLPTKVSHFCTAVKVNVKQTVNSTVTSALLAIKPSILFDIYTHNRSQSTVHNIASITVDGPAFSGPGFLSKCNFASANPHSHINAGSRFWSLAVFWPLWLATGQVQARCSTSICSARLEGGQERNFARPAAVLATGYESVNVGRLSIFQQFWLCS